MVALACQGALSSWQSSKPAAAETDSRCSTALPSPANTALPSPAAVELRNLPSHLCDGDMMECMLEQGGLEGLMVGQPVFTSGETSGQAIVFFASEEAAKACVALFRDCVWDSNVKAELVLATPALESEESQEPLLVISACSVESFRGAGADPNLPAKVELQSLYCSPSSRPAMPPGLEADTFLLPDAACASGDAWEKDMVRTSSTVDSASDLESQLDE